MSDFETRIAEVLAAHKAVGLRGMGLRGPDVTADCKCGVEVPGGPEGMRAHQAAALALVVADVYDDGRRAGVATHEHGKKGCFFDLANQPNPYRPS